MGHGGYWGGDTWEGKVVEGNKPSGAGGWPASPSVPAPNAVNAGKEYGIPAKSHEGGSNGSHHYSGRQDYPTYNAPALPAYKKCPGHDGLTVVYAYENGTTLSGASRYDLLKHGVDLLIDCGVDVPNGSFVKMCPPGFEDLKLHGIVPNVLRLDWPDRAAPSVGWEFWRALRDKFQPGWNVTACCIGGHGRTGTCLSALLIEDGMSAKDAIDQVRTVHCTSAVESAVQELYLDWLASVMPRREEGKE